MAETEQDNNRRGAIAGLVIAIVLLLVGIWLGARIDGGQQAAGLRDVGPNQLQRDRAGAISPANQIRKQNLRLQRRKIVAILPICNKTKREKLSAM